MPPEEPLDEGAPEPDDAPTGPLPDPLDRLGVLTSAHLLVGATAITVLTADGKTFNGTLVGTDADTDLALVSVPTTGLKKTDLGSLDSLKVAQAVFVVSRTKGQTPWVSIGVVSTRNAMQASPGGWTVGGLVLTSADATPDTTGGGLYDA